MDTCSRLLFFFSLQPSGVVNARCTIQFVKSGLGGGGGQDAGNRGLLGRVADPRRKTEQEVFVRGTLFFFFSFLSLLLRPPWAPPTTDEELIFWFCFKFKSQSGAAEEDDDDDFSPGACIPWPFMGPT